MRQQELHTRPVHSFAPCGILGFARCGVLAGIVCLVALAGIRLFPALQGSTVMFKRPTALVQACEAAGASVLALRPGAFFVDDCSSPIVTPILSEVGRVIVSRTVAGQAHDKDGGAATYSLKMDGRGSDGWRLMEAKRVASSLQLDVSLLTSGRPNPFHAANERNYGR